MLLWSLWCVWFSAIKNHHKAHTSYGSAAKKYVEKRTFDELFWSASQRMQMHFFFTENSFNLQCLKVQLLNFTEKSSSSVRFNRFHRVDSFTSTLYCFRFLSFALYSDTRILLYARRIHKKNIYNINVFTIYMVAVFQKYTAYK